MMPDRVGDSATEDNLSNKSDGVLVESAEKLFDLFRNKKYWHTDEPDEKWFFRGQSNAKWLLSPSIYNENLIAQKGVFSMRMNEHLDVASYDKDPKIRKYITKFIIPQKEVMKIRSILGTFENPINGHTVFLNGRMYSKLKSIADAIINNNYKDMEYDFLRE